MGGSGQLGTLAMSDVQVVPELLLSAYMIVAGVLLLVGRKRITRWCRVVDAPLPPPSRRAIWLRHLVGRPGLEPPSDGL